MLLEPRSVLAALLLATGLGAAAAERTVSDDPRLPNYDIRLDSSRPARATLDDMLRQSGRASHELQALRRQSRDGEQALRAQVPTLVVEYNPDLRIPEVVGTDVRTRTFLTGPGQPAGQKHAAQLKAFLRSNEGLFGLRAEQVTGLEVLADYTNPDGNLSYVDLGQRLNGLPVFRGEVRGMFTRDGRLARIVNNLAPQLEAEALETEAGQPRDALVAAAKHILREASDGDLRVTSEAPDGRRVEFAPGQFDGPTLAEQMYFPLEPGVARLAWRVLLYDRVAAYYVIVDAQTGTLLWRKNLVNDQTQPATYGVYNNDSPGPLSPSNATPGSGIQGAAIPRLTLTRIGNEPPYTFNQLGWITDGSNITDGNNVQAGLDRDGTNGVDAAGVPTGTPNRVFDFSYNPAPGIPAPGAEPLASGYPGPGNPMDDYQKGAVTNLFYWTNVYHDKLYLLGFTEAARNFQNDNFGLGGVAGDRVSAEAQDSSGTNNANFFTGADGVRGRMQMYIFTGPTPDRDGDLDQDVVIHELTHGLSNRLIGNATGLGNNRGGSMGEGWGDFYARALLSSAGENVAGVFTLGGYVTLNFQTLGTDNYYYGIRRFPHALISTTGGPLNRPHNPLTFADIDPAQIDISDGAYAPSAWIPASATSVHNAGEVWCAALLEVRARIIARLGFAAGNQRVLQLTTDGMKLSPLSPNFIHARDAILAAAQALGGSDVGDIWAGFAARGMGFGAQDGLPSSAVVESFALPNLQQTPDIAVSDVAGNDNGFPEPGERLGIEVPIFNPLSDPATGVTVSVNGGPPVAYGTINGGQTVTMSVPFRVPGAQACGSVVPLTFGINSSMGPTSAGADLRVGVPNVTAVLYSNPAPILAPAAATSGPAAPYPSTINVSGWTGAFDSLRMRLNDLTHTFPDDLDLLLYAPAGPRMVVMSDVGEGGDVTGVDLTLDDAAAARLPDTATLTSGSYRPTNVGIGDAFVAPAPPAPHNSPAPAGTDTLISTFGAANPNGTWSLYVIDDAGQDVGSISSGWSLEFSRTVYTCGWTKGDLDRDLATDLLFRRNTTGQNDVWLMNGTSRRQLVTLADAAPSLDWSIVGADDFSGDKFNDLVFRNGVTGEVQFWLMNGVARNGAPVPLSGAATLPPNWKLSATADFNHDGKPDIVWRNQTSQQIVIWTMNGTAKVGNITPDPSLAQDANWEIVGAVDLNDDGNTDFLWYNPNSGKLVYWWMDGNVVRTTGNFTNPSNAGNNNWKVLATGNYGTGPGGVSGSNDVVWRNASSGKVVVWQLDFAGNRTNGSFSTPDEPSPNPLEWTIVGPR